MAIVRCTICDMQIDLDTDVELVSEWEPEIVCVSCSPTNEDGVPINTEGDES